MGRVYHAVVELLFYRLLVVTPQLNQIQPLFDLGQGSPNVLHLGVEVHRYLPLVELGGDVTHVFLI